MAAKDYTFAAGVMNVYLTRRTKPRKGRASLMSEDSRPLDEQEVLFIFENYLRNWCDEHETDTLSVTGEGGKVLFEAVLKDKTEF